ncbi:MAG: TlpA family protein disulfide reductase [Saprospiraceae bacterium]
MKWHSFFAIFLVAIFFSCTEKPSISGTLSLPPNEDWTSRIYLIKPRSLEEVGSSFAGEVLDSAKIGKDGYFAFNELPASPNPILLLLAVQKKGNRFPNKLNNEDLSSSNYFPIIWDDQIKLEITAVINEFQKSFSIKNPSPENAALMELSAIRQQAFQQFLADKEGDSHDEEKLLASEAAIANFRQPIMDFAKNTQYLLPALMAIRWVSPENDYERVPEFLVAQCEKWQAKMSKHSWASQLCHKSNPDKLPILKGALVPNFPLPMLSNDTTNLRQLLGKRLTVLDLWASWCAPCRLENRNVLVPLWDKYHLDGFQIIGYALDGSEQGWKNAIEKDGANRWLHASHLRGDDAPLMETLRLQTIPANLILDAGGKVVAKNLHGEDLIQFVETYLTNSN